MESVTHEMWTPFLAGLRATSLDCLQTSIALLADQAYEPDIHARMGWRLSFPTRAADGGTRIDTSAATRLEHAAHVLGLRVGEFQAGPALWVRDAMRRDRPSLVIADGNGLPWLPYYGRRHVEHSFVVQAEQDGAVLVVDGYHIDTPWGSVRPGIWRLSAKEWDSLAGTYQVVDVEPGRLPAVDLAAWGAEAVRAAVDASACIEEYVAERARERSSASVLESVGLDIWILGRERELHAAWWSRHGLGPEAASRADAWQRLVTQSFLATRRRERGTVPDVGLFDQMHAELLADVDVLVGSARTNVSQADRPGSQVALRELVAEVVQQVLGLTEAPDPRCPLRSLPRYDSFRLVEVVGCVEERLNRPIASDVTGEELQNVDGLVAAFSRTAAGPAS
ncbi:hypothetical protein [Streptomyces sp. 7N604]|uniref:hypothetical protein n=1 Tax=Streptomyces sp. 7N604 TaxID=3457415 RepID=UPI003FCF27C0